MKDFHLSGLKHDVHAECSDGVIWGLAGGSVVVGAVIGAIILL